MALAAPPACADGLGGLAGLQGLATFAIVSFCLLWLGLWVAARAVRKPRGGKPYWLRDAGIPLPLRLLALAQYLLAFGYAFLAVTDLLMPGDFRGSSMISGLFAGVIASLAVVSAGGYLARSTVRGLQAGISLGWVCVTNSAVSFTLAEAPGEFDYVSLLLAASLLIVLWRNRAWFREPVVQPI